MTLSQYWINSGESSLTKRQIASKYDLPSSYVCSKISRCFITDTRSPYKVLTR